MNRIFATMMALLVCGVTTAATINVPADYTTIQAAVNAASDGDEIVVAPGVYNGSSNSVVSISKSIVLRSSGGHTVTIIDGEEARRGIWCNGVGDSTRIEGFTIRNGRAADGRGGAIYCRNSSPNISSCKMEFNRAMGDKWDLGRGGAVFCEYGGILQISDCEIVANAALGGFDGGLGGAIYADSNTTAYISNSTVCSNSSPIFDGDGEVINGGGNDFDDTCSGLVPGACCWVDFYGETYCFYVDEYSCFLNYFGEWQGEYVLCEFNPCATPPAGACCNGENCSITTQAGCNGDWLGEGTDCSGSPCYVPPTGACCNGEDCSITTEAGCAGDWLGEGTDCSGNPCYVPPTGACCTSGPCSITTEADCSGNWLGEGTDCMGDVCDGACCINGSCIITTEAGCSGDWLGEGTDCSGNPCYVPPTGACCINGSCNITTEAGCSGDWLGEDTDCNGDPCYVPPTGACCMPGSCSVRTEDDCTGDWLGEGTDCWCNPCDIKITLGACCNAGVCDITDVDDCWGEWLGPGTTCNSNPCRSDLDGACCVEETCTSTLEEDCAGEWFGIGVDCSDKPCKDFDGFCFDYVQFNAVPNTYTVQLYARIGHGGRLDAVYGNSSSPMRLDVLDGADLYQNWLGGPTSQDIHCEYFESDPSLRHDSYFTIGAHSSDGSGFWEPCEENYLQDVGINWSSFENGGGFFSDNGTFYIGSSDVQGKPIHGAVLIGQLTIYPGQAFDSDVVFAAGVQGKDAVGNTWNEYDSAYTVLTPWYWNCGPDCNNNGYGDNLDISYGHSPDCDGDGIIDVCAIDDGLTEDCNGNSIPDSCEISCGDTNGNGVLDECEDGACCINESCSVTTETDCSGDWLGEGTDCNGDPCYVPPTGACCIGQSCTATTEAGCSGDWLGESTDCENNPCDTQDKWTVDDDGPADFDNIQDAVNAASNGDTVTVMPGTYRGDGSSVVDLLGKSIALIAAGTTEETIIDGEGSRRAIVCIDGANSIAQITGFTFTNGHALHGAGIYLSNSNVILENCDFVGNGGEAACNSGGAIALHNSSTATVSGSTFTANSATYGGGIYLKEGSEATVVGCSITNNLAGQLGGGVYCEYSNLSLENCAVSTNTANWRGGGIDSQHCTLTLSNCTIEGNMSAAGDGGGICHRESPDQYSSLTNCTISNNTSSYAGGGAYCVNSVLMLSSCTISDNSAGNEGGGFATGTWSEIIPVFTDTIVCNNVPDQMYGAWEDAGSNTVADECPDDCTGDLDGNGEVGVDDVLALLAAYQLNADGDCDGDGDTDVDDLLVLISAWGPCP